MSGFTTSKPKPRITRSRARCNRCDDVIESKHRHDFVGCSCGAIFLDGGTAYVRYGYRAEGDITLMTEYEAQR